MTLGPVAVTTGGQLLAESLMVDTCSITRGNGSTSFDETNGREVPAAATVIYAGKCKVQTPDVQDRTHDAGERTWTLQRDSLHLPLSAPAVRVGDVATITAAALDAQLVGKRFRVVGLAHKTFLTARRLQVQEVTG